MAAIFDDLDPIWKPIAIAIDDDLKSQLVKCTAFCGSRSYAEQHTAFVNKASRCDGLNKISLHQAGLACDWVAVDERGNPSWDYVKYAATYKAIRDAIVKHGGEAGADWKDFPDPPHGQYKV
jgi:hypothetical protein